MTETKTVERADSADNGKSKLSDRVRSLRLNGGDAAATQNKGAVLAWGLCAILLLTTAALGYRTYKTTPAGSDGETASRVVPANQAGAATNPNAPVESVASSGAVALQAKGYIIPAHQVQVSPKITGMILWLNPRFEEGQRFEAPKEGAVVDINKNLLAKLEDVDYRADRDHAQAVLDSSIQHLGELQRSWPQEIAQAKAELAEQQANLKQLRLDLQRSQSLSRDNALAQKDLELAQFGYEAMDRRVARLKIAYDLMVKGPRVDKIRAAEADVAQARADLAKAQWRLDNCQITAPISGTILKKKAEKGNLVIPSAFASDNGLSASLCDMANLADLEVELKIQERDIAKVIVGQKCTVMPEAYQNFAKFRTVHPNGYAGQVSRMMPTADRGQSAIPVRVKLAVPKEEEGVYLKPDMGVIVNFINADN
ncbi:MAG: HlyD family secretion protein [Candidatus Acidiferrum sp.]